MNDCLLDVNQLYVSIAGKRVCDSLSLKVKRGECWAILGVNGVGKTTLLLTLAGLRSTQGGDISLNGCALSQINSVHRAKHISVLLQQTHDPFPSTVIESVLMGRHPYLSRWQWESAGDYAIALSALKKVGLQDYTQRQIQTLSGGERRRAAIATVLTQNTDILMLDEPANHLDLQHQQQCMQLLREHTLNQKACIMILHDINQAMKYCDKVMMLFGEGRCLVGNTDELMQRDNLQSLYNVSIKRLEQAGEMFFVVS